MLFQHTWCLQMNPRELTSGIRNIIMKGLGGDHVKVSPARIKFILPLYMGTHVT